MKNTNRIKELRLQNGLTLAELEARTGISAQQLNRLEKGERRLNETNLSLISQALGVSSPADILISSSKDSEGIPIVGEVGAGAEVIPIDDHAKGAALEYAAVPPGLALHGYIGVRVKGDSMYPRYLGGEVLVYKRNCDFDPSYYGDECIVKLVDGRMFVKVLRRGASDGLVTLESYNYPPIYDVHIEWACPVHIVLRRRV